MMTKVKFYVNKDIHLDPEGNVVHTSDLYAVFPDQIESEKMDGTARWFSGYAHIGQHAPVSEGYIAESREATAEEYTPLLIELQGIYDDLQVLNKN